MPNDTTTKTTNNSNTQIVLAIIGAVVTIITGYFGYLQVIFPTKEAIRVTQTANAIFATQTAAFNATSLAFEATRLAITHNLNSTGTSTPPYPTNTHTPTPIMPTATPTPSVTAYVTVSPTYTSVPAIPTPTDTATPIIITPTYTPTPSDESVEPKLTGKLAIPVIYGMQHKVYITNLDGNGINGPEPVSLTGSQPMFSHDGQILIVNGTDPDFSGVYITDGNGRNPEILIDRDSAHWPVLSPYTNDVIFVEATLKNELLKRTSNGNIIELQINGRPILATHLLWSDNNQLVFQGCATWLDQPGKCGTWISSVDNLDPKRIVVGNDYWPMDINNNTLVFISAKDGDWDIYRFSLVTRQLEKLTNNNIQDGLPTISPDGKSIAYISNESGAWAVWTLELRSKKKQRLFNINPERGTIDVNDWYNWVGERMSWAE